MASFYAELQLAGATYPVRHCTYEFTQSTSERGRVVAKVRHGLVQLTLDVPDEARLLDWANTAYKPLGGRVIFYADKGSAALETLAWEEGHCVSYQEEFSSGNLQEGAYVCHLTIATPTLTMQPGGPATYLPPAPGEHGSPQQAGMPVLEPEVVEKLVEVEAGRAILQRLAQGLLRFLTSAPAMTAALLLMPTNSRDDPGYKPEWDIGKLTQIPTDKDRARLDYLEAERERRALTEAETQELITLLVLVRKVMVGGAAGLAGYYAKQAQEAHLRQLVPDFSGVHLAGPRGEAAGEFDGINMAEKIFIEDKSAQGLDRINPKTGLKFQTPTEWAHKHVFSKTVTRIKALSNAPYTYPTPNSPPDVPTIEQIRGFERLHFRVDADTPDVRRAVEAEIQNLKAQYPTWDFTAQYGN